VSPPSPPNENPDTSVRAPSPSSSLLLLLSDGGADERIILKYHNPRGLNHRWHCRFAGRASARKAPPADSGGFARRRVFARRALTDGPRFPDDARDSAFQWTVRRWSERRCAPIDNNINIALVVVVVVVSVVVFAVVTIL